MRVQGFSLEGTLEICFYVSKNPMDTEYAPAPPWFRNDRKPVSPMSIWRRKQIPTCPSDLCVVEDALVVCIRSLNMIRSYSLVTLPSRGELAFPKRFSRDHFSRVRYCDQTLAWAIRDLKARSFLVLSASFRSNEFGALNLPGRIAEAVQIRNKSLSGYGHNGWSRIYVGVSDTYNNRILFLALPFVKASEDGLPRASSSKSSAREIALGQPA